MKIDWDKAPEGFPVWIESHYKNDPSDWHRQEENCFIDRKGGRWDQWQIDQGEATAHFKPDIWTGEGLPPVGIDVEIHNKTGLGVIEGAESFIGSKCTVLATFNNMHGYEMVSVEDASGSCMCFRSHMCFQVRTPEQIAADEREMGINAIHSMLDNCIRDLRGDAEALWDAGYRQQPTP